jgi:hypothetical protein
MKLSPLNFHLSIIVIEKQLGESVTPRLGESPREKRQHRNNLFAREGRLFPSEIREKRRFFAQKRPLNLSKIYNINEAIIIANSRNVKNIA